MYSANREQELEFQVDHLSKLVKKREEEIINLIVILLDTLTYNDKDIDERAYDAIDILKNYYK